MLLSYFLSLRYTDKSNLRERDLFQRVIDLNVWEGMAVVRESMVIGRVGVATGREAAIGRGRRLAGPIAFTLRNTRERERKGSSSPASPVITNLAKSRPASLPSLDLGFFCQDLK